MDTYHRMQRSFDFERGCPVGTAAYALQPDQEDFRATLGATFGRMRDALIGFFAAERRAGRLQREAQPRRLADFVLASVQGGMLLGLLERGPRPGSAAIDEAFRHPESYKTA